MFEVVRSGTRLYQVDFEVRAGEVMALVGDNGAGKSTLIKGIVGIYPFDEGTTTSRVSRSRSTAPRRCRPRHRSRVPGSRTGRQPRRRRQHVPRTRDGHQRASSTKRRWRRGRETLEGLKVTTLRSVRQTVAGLSGGQRQAVAVAKAVMWGDSKMIILDEPTAALGVAQTRQVLDMVERLAEQGYAVVLISHNLHDIFEVADRITVLRLGQQVGVLDRRQTTQQDVVHAITAGEMKFVPGMDEEVAAS